MRSWVFALACVVTTVTEIAPHQTAPPTPAPTRSTFAAASQESRLEMLRAINQAAIDRGQLKVAPDEVAGIVGLALRDADATMREAACYVVVATAARSRGSSGTDPSAPWLAAAAALLPLNDQLAQVMTSDPEPKVRHSAILALANLHLRVDDASGVIHIPAEFADVLAGAYGTETADGIRAEIVKTLALSVTDSPRRQEILERALTDSSPGVLQFAVTGAGRMKLARALPRLVELLTHPDRGIRIAAPQALANYGRDAAAYLPQLQVALASEKDDLVRRTLEGAIRAIQKT
jgi:HEAT repeat protein